MTVLVLIEDAEDELSRQAYAFAEGIEPEVGAIRITGDAYAPAAWATTLVELIAQRSPTAVVAPGTDRGNEVIAQMEQWKDFLPKGLVMGSALFPEHEGVWKLDQKIEVRPET